MKIAVIGRGHVGGGLARLWSDHGHQVRAFGRGGGDAAGVEAVVIAVAAKQISDPPGAMDGPAGQVAIDSHRIRSIIGGPAAKASSTNFASLYDRIGEQRVAPGNLYTADDGARSCAGLTRELAAESGPYFCRYTDQL